MKLINYCQSYLSSLKKFLENFPQTEKPEKTIHEREDVNVRVTKYHLADLITVKPWESGMKYKEQTVSKGKQEILLYALLIFS